MNCKECNNNEFVFDKLLGEEYCTQCGFVKVTMIFEEKPAFSKQDILNNTGVSGGLGGFISPKDVRTRKSNRLFRTNNMFGNRDKKRALRTGLRECHMVLSYHTQGQNLDSIKRLVTHYYSRLYEMDGMRGHSLTERACAIVFLSLRELEIPVTATEIGKKHKIKPTTVSRHARKYARKLKKSHKLHVFNTFSWVDRATTQLGTDADLYYDIRRMSEYIETVLDNSQISMTKTYLAAGIWFVNIMRKKDELTQTRICEVCCVSPVALRNAYKRFLPSINCEYDMLKNMTVDDFISGIRIG